jgi:hypothetical protein
MSPALFAKVERGGVFRKGVWGGKSGSLWEIYPGVTSTTAATSHRGDLGGYRPVTRLIVESYPRPRSPASLTLVGPPDFPLVGPPDFRDRLTQVLHGGDRLQLCRTKTSRKWWPRERRSRGGPEALSGWTEPAGSGARPLRQFSVSRERPPRSREGPAVRICFPPAGSPVRN